MNKIFLICALRRDSALSLCSFPSLVSQFELLFSLSCSVRTLIHCFCQSERIVKDFLPSWGRIWRPGLSPSQLGCVKPPVSCAHHSESPQADFQLLKNGFKYQTVLQRQGAWDCIKRSILSLWKSIYRSELLFKLMFAFQSHQATPGYSVSYHPQSEGILGMLGGRFGGMLRGRICSARGGMNSNSFGPPVLWHTSREC